MSMDLEKKEKKKEVRVLWKINMSNWPGGVTGTNEDLDVEI